MSSRDLDEYAPKSCAELEQRIAEQDATIAALREQLRETNRLVTTLHGEIQELESQRAIDLDDLDKYLDSYTRLEVEYFASKAQNNTLRKQLAGWQRNAAFYRSCALSGEVPTEPPYIDPQQEVKG